MGLMRALRCTILAAGMSLAAAAVWPAPALRAQAAKEIAVEVTNASEPVLCAEKDNVTVNLASREVRRFNIEAVHPSYIGTLQRDSFEADWTGCTAAVAGRQKVGKVRPTTQKSISS